MALSKRVQVLMDPDEYEWIRRTAQRQGVSVGELARAALRQVHGPPPPDSGDQGLLWFVNAGLELELPEDPTDLRRDHEDALVDRFEKLDPIRR